MTGTRWLWAIVAGLAVTGGAGAGMFDRKPKSASQVERLARALRSEPDEKRRRAVIAELKEADPRVVPDVIPALVGALQRDPSAQARADAAEAIGAFKTAFPAAGAALEAAAEADPAQAVREAAQQALWEYHLSGYRSTKGADGIAGQTAEPPLAKRLPRPAVPVVQTPSGPAVTSLKPAPADATPQQVAPPRVVFTAAPPLALDVTPEPPLAKRPPKAVVPLPTGLVPELPRPTLPPAAPVVPVPVPTPPPGLPTIPAIPGSIPPGK